MPQPVTRRQLIERAFEDLALAGYDFDLTADEIDSADRALDWLAGAWQARGAGIGLVASTLDDPCGVPIGYAEGVASNLALRIAGTKGKPVPQDLRNNAIEGRALIFRAAAMPIANVQSAYMPRGAGNGAHDYAPVFFPDAPADPLEQLLGP